MKKLILSSRIFFSFLLLFVILIISSCTGSKNVSSSDMRSNNANLIEPNKKRTTDSNWTTILRRVPGLDIRGSEGDLSVTLRGSATLTGDNEPLYVLDGVPLGRDLNALIRTIRPQEVDTINVLKGPQAARYGARGGNGVIEVKSIK